MWEICIDTGGTFTDCWGKNTETGEERRVKILSSSALRASIVELRHLKCGRTSILLNHKWQVPEDFFGGFSASLTESGAEVIPVVSSTGESLKIAGALPDS